MLSVKTSHESDEDIGEILDSRASLVVPPRTL